MRKRAIGVILASMLALSACASGQGTTTEMNESNADATESEEEAREKAIQKEERNLRDQFVTICENIFPDKIQRYLRWEMKDCADNHIGNVMVPILDENGTQDLSWFCEDICDWMEECTAQLPYEKVPWQYKEFIIAMPSQEIPFELTPYVENGFDREGLYGALYDFLDEELTSSDYNEHKSYGHLEYVDVVGSGEEFDMPFEPECSYTTSDGITFGMVPVDRAAGSSFYMLVASVDGGKRNIIVNEDPFLGGGGQAAWIEFIDDSDLGFACLTYNGGDDGMLYRTEDGGMSFTQINYPSAKLKLAGDSIYNPFVIPEKVWVEDGELYMLAGQSPYSGDYYSEELGKHPSGLYVSHNDGMSFEYVGEQ